MTWRNCEASLALVREVNARWPGRDRTSDGTIGDAAHASRSSDHNPWIVVGGVGVVRARDIDVNGIDVGWLFERLRVAGAHGDPRLAGGGYLILNRRITAPDFSGWRVYTGSNPHTGHGHVSFSRSIGGFDSRAPWGIAAAPPPITEEDFMATMSDAEKGELFAKIREIHQRETSALDFRGHHGEPKDNQQGQELSVRKELTWLREQINRMEEQNKRIEALLTSRTPA